MKKFFLLVSFILLFNISSSAMKIGILMPLGAEQDKTFGYMIKKGITFFAKKYPNIDIEYIYPENNTFFSAYLNYFSLDCDYIIAAGFMYREAVKEAAIANINRKYILIDNTLKLPNVLCLTFDDYQASFIMGAVTSKFFPNWNYGFIGAQRSFLTDKFQYGFINGTKYSGYNEKIEVNYLSEGIIGFINPNKAEKIADYMYSTNIDVIFSPCGSSAIGVLQSAVKNKKFIIGTDTSFERLSVSGVLYSISKRIDKILYKILYTCAIENSFKPGIQEFNFKNGGYEIENLNELDRYYGYRKANWLKDFINKINNGEIMY